MYQYVESGLPNIWLANGYEKKETPYGNAVSFYNIEGLHKTIGTLIISKSGSLSHDEIKFLRKELGWSQAHLGQMLGVASITVRKWESDDQRINSTADRLLKILYKESIDPDSLAKDLIALIDELSQLDLKKIANQALPMINFEVEGSNWKTKPESV